MRVKYFDTPLKPYIFGQTIEIRDAMNRIIVRTPILNPNYNAIKELKEVITDAARLLTEYYEKQAQTQNIQPTNTVKKIPANKPKRGRPKGS